MVYIILGLQIAADMVYYLAFQKKIKVLLVAPIPDMVHDGGTQERIMSME